MLAITAVACPTVLFTICSSFVKIPRLATKLISCFRILDKLGKVRIGAKVRLGRESPDALPQFEWAFS